jgi:hypothetical protein
MAAIMRLYEDVLSGEEGLHFELPPLPRLIYVVHGSVAINGGPLGDAETWHGESSVTLATERAGATCWRFELARSGTPEAALPGGGAISRKKLEASAATLQAGELLLRGDSVAFPPGGCAYRHRHQGPGIRCLLEGGIRIDTHGRSISYGPGGAWYETGPDPVFAQAALDRPSRFIRMMILPRSLLGKSSIEYLDPADKDKPRSQSYTIFADAPIAFEASAG